MPQGFPKHTNSLAGRNGHSTDCGHLSSVLGITSFITCCKGINTKDRDLAMAAGPEFGKVFEAVDAARTMIDQKQVTKQWNEAVGLVINGKAAANIMGDWAGGEFQVAKMVPGKDYDCLPGLGVTPCDLSTSTGPSAGSLEHNKLCRSQCKKQVGSWDAEYHSTFLWWRFL